MKKLLLSAILILILILTGLTVAKGINISNISVFGIKQIQEENNNLDSKLQEATKLASTDYEKSQNDLNSKMQDLQNKKKELEDKQNTTAENYLNGITPSGLPYKIDYLWVTIGNYAKSEGITMKMDTVKNGKEYVGNDQRTEEKDKIYYYDISFTVTGNYINIAEFLIHIEDDSSLAFKIEEFNMTSSSDNGNIVQATFKCKDIPIKGASSNSVSPTNTTEQNTSAQNTTSTENTTNTVQ